MNPLTLYFAGAFAGKASPEELKVGIRNKLCSYVYPEQFQSWIQISKGFSGKILIDSGAFSVWNRGKTIDLKEYISYCKEVIKIAKDEEKEIRVVNLDVIPGKKGETASLNKSRNLEDKKIIEEAAKQGYENLCCFLDEGIVPIHVFHQGESFEWLDKMVLKTDYIGVSPANDVSQKAKEMWMMKTFGYLQEKAPYIKTHGFAVFSPDSFKRYPWTSCDAATWRLVAGYGKFFYPKGGFSNSNYTVNPTIIEISEKMINEQYIQLWEMLEPQLEKDGYSYQQLQNWEERAKINIRYFLELEKWVNKIREKKEFVKRQSIFDL